MSSSNKKNEEEKKESAKIITIRNIDEETYNKIVALAKSLGVTVGELVNEALRLTLSLFIEPIEKIERTTKSFGERRAKEAVKAIAEKIKSSLEEEYIIISDLDKLSISKKDLESLDKQLVVRNIKKLVIERDVDRESLDKIAKIIFVDELYIPETLPKLMVLSKAKMVKEVKIYT